ncbi:putative L-carnitine dehydratase [Lentzea sp. NBRC 105346]|uniref:CaiB/BaiF CoA transferase family protein n=1 Tax=Lentzea sp. NBRC 105346 TaxID=3032205 RepID=UPI0024A00765|nr:CoA transferase [Lentzea sp. NBRC 105346]GLZ29547.1 putative L-carnitine dehydratase [Lentzea sp. NBRC 105346]
MNVRHTGPERKTRALGGLVIADFSRVLAAPYATMMLGDLGAEVIKVEQPGRGDETRTWGPPWVEDEATYFLSVNRNKSSVFIDLGTPEGVESARQLIARADVVVENFKPGTMKKFGLDYESLGREDLVYCSVTGFGAGSELPGYDLLVQAVGGLMSMTGTDQPVKTGVALVDVLTGLHATIGILAALRHRDATGQGQLVELNLLSVLLSSMVNQSAGYALAGAVPRFMGNRHPSIAPYEVFPTADRPIVLAVGNDRQFERLCASLDLPVDPRFATNTLRVQHVDELYEVLSARLLTKPAEHWFSVLDVPCGPVNDLAAAFDLASSLGLSPTVDIDGLSFVSNPIRMSRTPVSYRLRPPQLRSE